MTLGLTYCSLIIAYRLRTTVTPARLSEKGDPGIKRLQCKNRKSFFGSGRENYSATFHF
jgi:hypothetical protein